ncbi:hypothetical protein [Streptomyces sp. KL116D]|uniref:hypothetical protein n=1 Tax=Streptomyces sp. KL116D TaxID=3045152 RepID=UPI003557AA2D
MISVVVGAGIGLAYSSLPALIITRAVDPSETGAANGLNTLMRSIGTSVSSAVIGMVLANTAHQAHGVAVPTMHGFHISFLIATAASRGGRPARRLPAEAQHGPAGQLRASSERSANLARAEELLAAFRGRVLDPAGAPVARAR